MSRDSRIPTRLRAAATTSSAPAFVVERRLDTLLAIGLPRRGGDGQLLVRGLDALAEPVLLRAVDDRSGLRDRDDASRSDRREDVVHGWHGIDAAVHGMR